MEEKILCKCPQCGGNVIGDKYSWKCEHYGDSCSFKLSKNICGTEITEDIAKTVCDKKPTELLSFKKEEKTWKAKLQFIESEGLVKFVFDRKYVGTCPVCGKRMKETQQFYMCEDYKNPCTAIIAKNIRGHELTKEELEKLLNGETLHDLSFFWNSGKSGKADIKLKDDGKVTFVFND